MLALLLCCDHLEIRNHCQTRSSMFSFALGPANNVAVQGADVCKQSILLFSEGPHKCVWERPNNPRGPWSPRKGRHTLGSGQDHPWQCRKEILKLLFMNTFSHCLSLFLNVASCYAFFLPFHGNANFTELPILGTQPPKFQNCLYLASIAAWCLIADVAVWSFLTDRTLVNMML